MRRTNLAPSMAIPGNPTTPPREQGWTELTMFHPDRIRRQWLATLLASLGLIIGLGIGINLLMTRTEA